MSYADPQSWTDVDAGGNPLDWTSRENKLLYPAYEMLRKSILEKMDYENSRSGEGGYGRTLVAGTSLQTAFSINMLQPPPVFFMDFDALLFLLIYVSVEFGNRKSPYQFFTPTPAVSGVPYATETVNQYGSNWTRFGILSMGSLATYAGYNYQTGTASISGNTFTSTNHNLEVDNIVVLESAANAPWTSGAELFYVLSKTTHTFTLSSYKNGVQAVFADSGSQEWTSGICPTPSVPKAEWEIQRYKMLNQLRYGYYPNGYGGVSLATEYNLYDGVGWLPAVYIKTGARRWVASADRHRTTLSVTGLSSNIKKIYMVGVPTGDGLSFGSHDDVDLNSNALFVISNQGGVYLKQGPETGNPRQVLYSGNNAYPPGSNNTGYAVSVALTREIDFNFKDW